MLGDWIRRVLSRARSALRLHRVDEDFQRELASHLELMTEDNIRRGMEPGEARRQARLRLGGLDQLRETNLELQGLPFIDRLMQDLRYGWRVLRKSPGFTITAVLTMAMGIGASAVVFAAFNAIILRPLSVPRPESLYSIHRTDDLAAQSYPDYIDLRDRNQSFEDLAAYNIVLAGLDTGGNPSRAWGIAASGNYFDVLGVQPLLGRVFHVGEEHGSNSAPYVVLTYSYWHGHFRDDRDVVGRTIQLNKHPFTIIGVTPPEFRGTLLIASPDFFLPMVNQEQVDGSNLLNDRGNRDAIFMALGHLKSGVAPAQAAADVNLIWSDLVKTYPKDHAPAKFALARPSLYGERLGRPMRAFLVGLMLLAVLILLAACANLGSLFAARANDRSREVALRLALGGRRLRILRQLFTEALLISVSGGALGLCGALLLLRLLRAWQPFPQWPLNIPFAPDRNVYAVAVLLSVASGLLFGAVPVTQVLGADSYEIIKPGSQSRAGRRIPFRDLLLVGQIAMCAVLVTSSLVAVRGLGRSLHSHLGFEPRNTILVNTLLEMAGYGKDQVPDMQKRMVEAMRTIPGVASVGLVDRVPLNGNVGAGLIFADQTSDLRPANATASASVMAVSPEYLQAAGTALLAGRCFSPDDDKDGPRVAIVNQEFARRIFGSEATAVGKYFKQQDGARFQVVGVAEDGKYGNLTEDPEPAMFLPLLQSPASNTWLVVRSFAETQALATAIKSKLAGLDSGLPSFIESWGSAMGLPLFPARMATAALGILGLIGTVLSFVGIFGMAAYSVSKRMKELGIRMALGAQRAQVLEAALGRSLKSLALGSAAGLLFGILISRVLSSVVYQATPRDPLVLGGAAVAMSLVGLLATWIPAQRALSLRPLVLLRED
jgi:predicted permease